MSEALVNWILYFSIFLLFGGLGAGIVTLLFQAIIGIEFSSFLYAVIFGGSGLIACVAFRNVRERST
jgi:hypothetical protein